MTDDPLHGRPLPDDGRTARIDVHHHYTPPAWLDWAVGQGLAHRARLPWWARWELDSTLSLMDKAGVRTAVLTITLPAGGYRDEAQERESLRVAYAAAAELVEAHPGRFAFFAKISLDDPELARWSWHQGRDLGAVGVSVFTHDAKGRYLGDPAFDGLFAELAEQSTVVNVHPTELPGLSKRDQAVGGVPSFVCDFLLDTTRAAVNLIHKGTLDRFPGLSFILPHCGGFLPYLAGRLEISGEFMDPELDPAKARGCLRRFYYDTAAPLSPSATPTLLATAGPDRILYATDWPATRPYVIVDAGASLDTDPSLDTHQRLGINRANALALIPTLQ